MSASLQKLGELRFIEYTSEKLAYYKSLGRAYDEHRIQLYNFFDVNYERFSPIVNFNTGERRSDIEYAYRFYFNIPSSVKKPEGGWKKDRNYVEFTNALTYWRNTYYKSSMSD